MKRSDYKEKKLKEAVDFFRKFIAMVSKGKVKDIHWGWWHVGGNKFGLSMYWEQEK